MLVQTGRLFWILTVAAESLPAFLVKIAFACLAWPEISTKYHEDQALCCPLRENELAGR